MSNQSRGRPNGGYLFPNKKDPQLDFRGKLNVDGTDYVLTGAYLERDGDTVISLALEGVVSHGFLANNTKTKETQPDFRGTLTVSEKEVRLSGWNKPKENETMISLAVSDMAAYNENAPKTDKPSSAPSSAPAASSSLDDMGDIFSGLPG